MIQPCPDVFWFPAVTPTFCKHLDEMERISLEDGTYKASDMEAITKLLTEIRDKSNNQTAVMDPTEVQRKVDY